MKNIAHTGTEFQRSKKTINFAAVVNENGDVFLVILHYFLFMLKRKTWYFMLDIH